MIRATTMPKVSATFCCAVLMGFCQVLVASQATVEEASHSSTREDSLRSFLQGYVRQRGFPNDETTRYFFAFVDLNRDGKDEAIVYLAGRWWCGSGGCPMYVLEPYSNTYKFVSKTVITRPPIRVLARTSHGWHSIAVWVEGGGIPRPYEAELRFDGRTYPNSPADPPARRLTEKVEGRIVIPSLKGGTPLYP
jgi:hypothetical protein